MKTCKKCEETKEDKGFHRCSRNKDGLHTYCKECRNEVAKEKAKTNEGRARNSIAASKYYHKVKNGIDHSWK